MAATTKLAQLVIWVRENTNGERAFHKAALFSFARSIDLESSARTFVFRCRQKGTMHDRDDNRIEVLVPKGRSLEQFYNNLLKIQDRPIVKPKPEAEAERRKEEAFKKEKEPQREEKDEKPTAPCGEVDLVNAVALRLEDRFRRIDETIASISRTVEERIENLEKNVSLVLVEEQEKRIKHLEKQLEQFRAKAEAFDLIKRDAWEVVQALDMVEAEREDVKKVLKRFL